MSTLPCRALLLLAWGLIAQPATPARAQDGPPCRSPALTTGLRDRLAKTITPGNEPFEVLQAAAISAVAVRVRDRCTSVFALNADGEFAGGVTVLDPEDTTRVYEIDRYPGARNLRAAGPGRVLFEYTQGRGSGLYESRFVVLCAFTATSWIRCFDTVARDFTSVSACSDEHFADCGTTEIDATVDVRGDTLFFHRIAKTQRWNGPSRVRDLGVSRVLLPDYRR